MTASYVPEPLEGPADCKFSIHLAVFQANGSKATNGIKYREAVGLRTRGISLGGFTAILALV